MDELLIFCGNSFEERSNFFSFTSVYLFHIWWRHTKVLLFSWQPLMS